MLHMSSGLENPKTTTTCNVYDPALLADQSCSLLAKSKNTITCNDESVIRNRNRHFPRSLRLTKMFRSKADFSLLRGTALHAISLVYW